MTLDGKQHPTQREWHGAHHFWCYRPNAFRWDGERIAGINFYPLASQMRKWMDRSGDLPVVTDADRQKSGGYKNPYTFNGVALVLLLSRVINAFHEYATMSSPDHDSMDAEVERLRLYNELLLYSARVCEVVIKQLLHCTQFPEARYRRMALGALLESPCPSCKRENGNVPHTVSMVGTLAHPFRLCLEFEHCAMDHMDLVNKLRNSQAAHSEIQALNIRSVQESKDQLLKDGTEVMTSFHHMLWHLEKLEGHMFSDLAEKGDSITMLRLNGLPPEERNYRLIPGERFVFGSDADRR